MPADSLTTALVRPLRSLAAVTGRLRGRLLLALAAATLATGAAGCTDQGPWLRVGDAAGPIDLPREDWDFSVGQGSTGLYPTGTVEFPHAVTVRFDAEVWAGDDTDRMGVHAGTLEVVDGSSCRVAVPVRCTGGHCDAELEITSIGTCLVRARATTVEGDQVGACWFRAVDVGEGPEAQARFEALGEASMAMHEACERGL